MKKEYTHPVAEQVPLLMDQSLCQASIVTYLLIEGNENPETLFDGDSD